MTEVLWECPVRIWNVCWSSMNYRRPHVLSWSLPIQLKSMSLSDVLGVDAICTWLWWYEGVFFLLNWFALQTNSHPPPPESWGRKLTKKLSAHLFNFPIFRLVWRRSASKQWRKTRRWRMGRMKAENKCPPTSRTAITKNPQSTTRSWWELLWASTILFHVMNRCHWNFRRQGKSQR